MHHLYHSYPMMLPWPLSIHLQDAPSTPFLRHFEVNLPDAVGEALQTGSRPWQTERLQWPVLGGLMVQHRPVGEVPSAPAIAGMAEEGQWVGKLYSTPVVKREEQPEAYNIRQQIGEFGVEDYRRILLLLLLLFLDDGAWMIG